MTKRIFLFLAVISLFTVSTSAQTGLDYPKPRRSDQVDEFHGVKVADPYRWLEDTDSAETRAWIDAENKLTNAYLSGIPQRAAINKRLTELWNYERFSPPVRRGNYYIYSRNDGLQNQSVLYRAESLKDAGTVFFDPNKLRSDGTAALAGSSFTDDGKLWAYAVAEAGSDRNEWHVMDVATGKLLPDTIAPNRTYNVQWLKDNSGFFYASYAPVAKGAELKANTQFQKLYFHKLGTLQAEDKIVYERPDNGEYFVAGEVSEDGRWLIITVGKGTEPMNMVYYKDLTRENSKVREVVNNLDYNYTFLGNDGGIFYFQTDRLAPLGKIVRINLWPDEKTRREEFADALKAGISAPFPLGEGHPPLWEDVVPESKDTLDSVSFINNQLVLKYMHDAHSSIKIYQPDGKFVRDVELPGIGSAYGFAGKRREPETFYSYSSFNAPATIYRLDLQTGQSSVFREAKVKFDPAAYEVKQVFYNSKDGTRVPMFIVSKKGIKLDGSNPTLLYGYGGFNAAMTPGFSPAYIAWLEMGGVYALANIRGGSEYGRKWWEGGSRLNKQNVFDDFIAAAEYLVREKYTSTPKLAINGGSNGGLLIGAVLNQRPDLFAAAVPQVGVMDMLRFSKFTIGWAWASDYGSPEDAADFKAMYAYSPYHNAKPGTKYPATLITTADHDDRVFPAHSFKYAAAMQAAQAGDAPVLIRIETRAGHGAGKPVSKQIEEFTDIYGFLVKNLGMQ